MQLQCARCARYCDLVIEEGAATRAVQAAAAAQLAVRGGAACACCPVAVRCATRWVMGTFRNGCGSTRGQARAASSRWDAEHRAHDTALQSCSALHHQLPKANDQLAHGRQAASDAGGRHLLPLPGAPTPARQASCEPTYVSRELQACRRPQQHSRQGLCLQQLHSHAVH